MEQVLLALLTVISDKNTPPETKGWAKGRFNDITDILKKQRENKE